MRPSRLTPIVLTHLALAATATAQGTIVVPPAASHYSSDKSSSTLFGGGSLGGALDAHTQLLYDTGAIPVASATMRSLQFRPLAISPFGPYSVRTATAADLEISMSLSSRAPGAASTTFAQNTGPNPVRVFSGRVSLPTTQPPAAWPASWQAPVAFSTPFSYSGSAGASLVVDIVATNRANNFGWFVEEYQQDVGTLGIAWSDGACKTLANRSPGLTARPQNVVVGGSYWHSSCCYSNKASFATNALLFGLRGPGGSFLGRSLPASLQSLGIPANPACSLAVEPLVAVPMAMQLGSGSAPTTMFSIGPLPIPNTPSMVHFTFYTQHLLLDTDASQSLIYAASAYRWRVGTGMPMPAATVYYPDDGTRADGAVRPSAAVSLRFNF